LSTPDLTPIGVAISPTIALFNHACAPNAVVVFPEGCPPGAEGGMKVVLISDIQPGEEVSTHIIPKAKLTTKSQILTSYIDVSLPRHLRQKDLEARYGFTCACTLCGRFDPARGKVDPRWCIYHPGCDRAGLVAMPGAFFLGLFWNSG
jgi:hypothetical protein